MDCNHNQRCACTCRPQMQPNMAPQQPPMQPNIPPQQPQMQPNMPQQPHVHMPQMTQPAQACDMPVFLRPNREDGMSGKALAMAYVPWQPWGQTYSLEQALSRGTIFPELDLPFVMGRCRG